MFKIKRRDVGRWLKSVRSRADRFIDDVRGPFVLIVRSNKKKNPGTDTLGSSLSCKTLSNLSSSGSEKQSDPFSSTKGGRGAYINRKDDFKMVIKYVVYFSNVLFLDITMGSLISTALWKQQNLNFICRFPDASNQIAIHRCIKYFSKVILNHH